MIRINTPNAINYNKALYKNKSTSFKGHYGTERCLKPGINRLIHETGFFRNLQTKNFVVDYIHKNFSHKPNIRLLIGACSTGEEAYSYSMLLDDIKEKLSIIGFDLGEKAIEDARSKKCIMLKPKEDPGNGLRYVYHSHDSLNDSFLCFDRKKPLSREECALKEIFSTFFEETNETVIKKPKTISQKFNAFLLKLFWKMIPNEYYEKIIKLKDGKATNCTFKEGDILKLDEISQGKKADVITFANAMYHLVCDEILNGTRRMPKKNAEKIIENIAENVKRNLNPNGIFVLGEDEATQTLSSKLISKVFKNAGFEAMNQTFEHEANVWRLK